MRPALVVLSLLALCLAMPAQAGLEPIPFRPEVNQLRARENSLLAHLEHINAVLGFEPTPFQPVVGQLNTLAKQVAKNDAKIFGIVDPVYDAVLASPPEDRVPFFDVLADLDFVAGAIHDRAVEGFEIPPDNPEVLDALATLQTNAGDLQDTIQFYLPDLESDYTVRTYYYGVATLLEVQLWFYTAGSCPTMGLPVETPSFGQLLTANPDGTIPDYAFDSDNAITMVAAVGWGQDVPGGPPGWITMGCENVSGAPPTVIHVVMEDIPGS